MTTIDTHAEAAVATTAAPSGVGRFLGAVAGWLTTSDHKKIGQTVIDFTLLFSLGVAVIGALLGFERMDTDSISLDTDSLGQLFSLFRVGLVFMVVVPLALGVAVAIVPLQVGSKTLSFPKAAALGMWTWLVGTGLVIGAYADNGGPGGGSESSVDLFLAGLGLAVLGLLILAVCVATTVLTSRAPGMHVDEVPMLAWSALVGSVALLLTLPMLLANLIYMFVDHRYGARTPLEANGWGGNAGIDHWLRPSLTQPQTYVYALVVLGLFAELIPVFTKRRAMLRPVVLAGVAIFSLASLAGVTQTDHGIRSWNDLGAFDKVQDIVPYLFFNALPLLGLLVVVGGGAQLLLPSLKARTFKPSAPLLFAVIAVAMVGAGATAHLLSPITDLQLAGTVYEEAEFTFIVYGIVIAGMGAVAYWGPKWTGRKMPMVPAALLALAAGGAATLASAPYLIAGFNNQPGVWGVDDPTQLVSGFDNDAAPELMNFLNGLGHALMGVTLLAFILLALRSFTKGPFAGDDPWDGQTLEWATSSPPPADNFVDLPIVRSPEPLTDLKLSRGEA